MCVKKLLIAGVSLSLMACSTMHPKAPSTPPAPETHILKSHVEKGRITFETSQNQYRLYGWSLNYKVNEFRTFVQDFAPSIQSGSVSIQERENPSQAGDIIARYELIVDETKFSPEQKITIRKRYSAKPHPTKGIYEKFPKKELSVTFRLDGTQTPLYRVSADKQLSDEHKLAQPIPIRFINSSRNNNEIGTALFFPFYMIISMFGCATSQCV